MKNVLIKLFVPNASNNYYPLATKSVALILYCFIFLFTNLFLFPKLGIESSRVLGANIDVSEIVTLANKDRTAQGLGQLKWNDDLARAAFAKGRDMLNKQYWSHYGPNGETPWQFISSAGYNYIYAGENLAKDFQNSLDAHLAWMKSPTHRANILNANYRDVGVSYVTGEFQGHTSTIIVQMFGSKEINSSSNNNPTQPQNSGPDDGISTYKPTIKSPESNSMLQNPNITLSGESTKGDTIKVFSNDKLIGELPKDQNNFTVNVSLLGNELNALTIKSKDSKNLKESLPSDPISVIIDSVPPDLSKATFGYYYNGNRIFLTISSEEAIKKITFTSGTLNQTFIFKDNIFSTNIPDTVSSGTLSFYDQAGNLSEKYVELSKEKQTKGVPLQLPASTSSNNNFFSLPKFSFTQLGTKDIFNLGMATFLLIAFAVDAIFLIKAKKLREFTSKHGFHLAVIMVVLISVVTVTQL